MGPKSKAQSQKSGSSLTLQRFGAATLQRRNASTLERSNAFTLIELMVVVAIMGIVMAMGVPAIYRVWRGEPLRKAASDVQEVCANARARAILQGTTVEVVFHPQEGRFELVGGSSPGSSAAATAGPVPAGMPATAGSGLSGQIPGDVEIEMLDVNLMEFKEQEAAHVRFHANGTCDELTLILRSLNPHSGGSAVRIITTEVTTGLTSIDSDPAKLLSLKR